MSQPAAICVSGVAKRFGTARILENVHFSVGAGECVALLGRSGSGKSTLLHLIAGLIEPDVGEVRLGGRPPLEVPCSEAPGYLFQEDRLLPWRNALDNAALGLEAARPRLPARVRRARAREALHRLGLAGHEQAFPHQLSGGMRSRVALARSLVTDTRLLLLDEPFSKLDPGTRTQMHEILLRLREQTVLTVLFVTHDVEEAVMLADRVLILGQHPGTVRDSLPVQLARPRRAIDPGFGEQVRQLRLRMQ